METVLNSLKKGQDFNINPWKAFQYTLFRNSKTKADRCNTSYKVVREK